MVQFEQLQLVCIAGYCLHFSFNMSLQEGSVPLEWKEANIIPLFKTRFKKQVCKL